MFDTHIARLTHLKANGFQPRSIIDVGAHNGAWSAAIRTVYPESSFFLIEANPEQDAILKERGLRYEIALLGDEDKDSISYYQAKEGCNTGNSIFEESSDVDFRQIELPMRRLDDVIQKRHVPKPDLLKLDVQGSELNVLKGAVETIQETNFILLEMQVLEYNIGAPTFAETVAYLDEIGFQIYDLIEVHYLQTNHLNEIDLLFIRKGSEFLDKAYQLQFSKK